ncbi:MAG: SPOR domain-containing protein [Vicinamibacterales bacterium]
MNSQTHDDGFHEIQLNGKQLVFLFMAATVVSVVIFLCGVLVGRGVQTEVAAQDSPADSMVLSDGPMAAPADTQEAPSAVVTPDADPRAADAPPEVDDLSYFSRLEQSGPDAESLKPQAPEPARAEVEAPRPAARPAQAQRAQRTAAPPRPAPAAAAAVPAAATTQAAAPSRPAPGDWTVQVAALNARPEAEAVAKRLADKGYSAYVVTPGNGGPAVFRVRIGPFRTRNDADNMAARLEKEEQFKPWVTR